MGTTASDGRLSEWLEIAGSIAIEAGAVIREKAHSGLQVLHKGPVDLVTEADVAAEKYIISQLEERFPDHNILGEESGGESSDGFLWVIDPIDGTTNYAHGFPVYAVSIGLMFDKESVLGVVYDPNLRELFTALRGQGAYLNGRRIKVSQVDDLEQALLATGFPYALREMPEQVLKNFADIILACQGVRRAGAATIDLCSVAAGRFDGFWEVGLKPWDTAAAALIVEEAGGVISRYDGSAFDHFLPEMVATNGLIHRSLLNIFRKPMKTDH